MGKLNGRTAIVTGASRGIGVHIARALAREGVNLALVARSAAPLQDLARDLARAGTRAVAIACDLSDTKRLDLLLDRAEAELGPIDLLVNNAAIDAIRGYLAETDAQTEEMLRLDLLSPMLLTRKCVIRMMERKTGHVVNLASLAGKSPTPYFVSYGAAKGGLIAFTHSLRGELRGSGVSASVVIPGFVALEGMWAQRAQPRGVQVPALLGTSRPDQVARAVLDAWRSDRAEVVVNPGPIRFIQALNQLAPEAIAWMQERMGVNGMLRSMAVSERGNGLSRHAH